MPGRGKTDKTTYRWVMNPHTGGVPLTPSAKAEAERRLRAHGERCYAGKYRRLDIRFRGALCYISAVTAESDLPMNLCRIRHFATDRWSVAFYAYSSEKYEPSFFANGTFFGTPEEGFDVGAVYLQ